MSATAVLHRPVLALNRHWQPVQTTPAANAIALVVKGSAVIIDPGTWEEHTLRTWADVSRARDRFADALIRSPRLTLVVPEVIRLTRYDRLGARTVVFSRRNLFKRDRHACQYCGARPGPAELTIDHVMPRSRGGRSEWTNCVLACLACNGRKADRTPAEAGLSLRRAPRKPSWTALDPLPAARRPLSWERFLSKAYWEVELET
jgi:5-methylcytosine-specific restriction endonuclease McrA